MAQTNLILGGHVIHTRYTGDVLHEEMVIAVRNQGELIKKHPNICVLIFDYTRARMIEESELEVMEIAQMSEELTRSNPNLEFIGITPSLVDFGVTRMWRAYSELRAGVSGDQMHIFRDFGEAMKLAAEIVERKTSDPLSNIS